MTENERVYLSTFPSFKREQHMVDWVIEVNKWRVDFEVSLRSRLKDHDFEVSKVVRNETNCHCEICDFIRKEILGDE